MNRRAVALLALTGACTTGEVLPPDIERDLVEVKQFGSWVPDRTDILFVVDNSPAMAAQRPYLPDGFRAFAENMLTYGDLFFGGTPMDMHIAVVTTDIGGPGSRFDDGAFQTARHVADDFGEHVEACSMLAPDATYLQQAPRRSLSDSPPSNFTGDFAEALACIGEVGSYGATFISPLEAMRRALTRAQANVGDATGFLREDARLVVIIITANDDCSPAAGDDAPALWSTDTALGPRSTFRCFEHGVTCDQDVRPDDATSGPEVPVPLTGCVPDEASTVVAPVTPYIEFVRGLKANPRDVQVAVATPGTAPIAVTQAGGNGPLATWFSLAQVCDETTALLPMPATPALRIDAFRRAFTDRNYAQSVCQPGFEDLSVGLTTMIGAYVGKPCLYHPLADRNPDLPGLQAECAVSFTSDEPADAAAPTIVVPACDVAPDPRVCWRLLDNDSDCEGLLAIDVVWADGIRVDGMFDLACSIADD